MTDPKRLLVAGETPEGARQLLRAIEVPTPPNAAQQGELVQRLATLAAEPGLAAATAAGGLWKKLALVGGGSAGSAALLLAALHVFSGAPETAANEPTERATIESTSSLVAAPPAPAPAPAPRAAATTVAASNDATKARVLSSLPARAVQRSNPDALAAEEALLERARGFASSAPARAWELLERHRRRFPAGQLVAERLSLSVDVLQRLGETQSAQAQAEMLMIQFPGSVYAKQLRQRDGLDPPAHP